MATRKNTAPTKTKRLNKRTREIAAMFDRLTVEQKRSVMYLIRLLNAQTAHPTPEVAAEIAAIMDAGREGRVLLTMLEHATPNRH